MIRIIGDWQIDLETGDLVHIPCGVICTAWRHSSREIHIMCGKQNDEIDIPPLIISIVRGYPECK